MPEQRSFPRWLVLAICFLGFNMTMGFAFGSFGPLLQSMEQHFGISRSAASLGMACTNLAIGGLAPFLGNIMQRVPVPYAMAAGSALSAIGYFGLGTLSYYPLGLLMFVLVGAGISLSGVIGPLTMISRWYPEGRGAALAIVNLPVAMLVTPFIVSEALPVVGRSAILLTVALVFAALIPLFLILRDPAPRQGSAAVAPAPSAPPVTEIAAGTGASAPLNNRQILSAPAFWFLSLAMGIMSGSGTIFYVHMVAFGTGQGMSLPAAAGLLSIFAAAGMLGVPLFGRIADWLGPPQTLLLVGFFQMILWLTFLVVPIEGLFVAAALLGVCAMPMLVLHGAAISTLIPVSSVSRAMGLSYAIKLPFLFAAAPAIAFVFERTGGYLVPFTTVAALMGVCCILFLALTISTRQRPPLALAAE